MREFIYNLFNNKNFLLVATTVIAILFPTVIKKEIASLTTKLLFFIFITLTFLDIELKYIKKINNYSKVILTIIAYDFIIWPLIIFLLIKTKILDEILAISFLFLVMAPTAISSIYLISLVKGKKEESLDIVLITHVLAVILIPLIIKIFSSLLPSLNEVGINPLSVFKTLVIFIIIPLVIANLIKKYPKIKAKANSLKKYLFYILLIIIFLSINSNREYLKKEFLGYLEETILIIMYFIIMAIINLILFKNSKEEEKVILLDSVYKNYILTIILLISLGGEYIVLPVIYNILVNFYLVFFFKFAEKVNKINY